MRSREGELSSLLALKRQCSSGALVEAALDNFDAAARNYELALQALTLLDSLGPPESTQKAADRLRAQLEDAQ